MGQISPEIVKIINESRGTSEDTPICLAPFINLSLNTLGNVGACCSTFHYVPDNSFPKHTLKELWHGRHLSTLRKNLSQNFMSNKCRDCDHQLNNKNYTSTLLHGYNHVPVNANGMPSIIDIELSNRCNLQCVMCDGNHSSMYRKNISKQPPLLSPYDSQFLEQLKDFIPHVHEMRFQGGEPLMDPLHYEIMDLVIQMNPKVSFSITTNCTIYTERFENILRTLNIKLFLSIDAAEKAVYENIRRNANFETTMHNFKRYVKLSREVGFKLHVSVCPMTINWEQMPLMLELCNENEVFIWYHTLFKPEELSLANLAPSILDSIYKTLAAHPVNPSTSPIVERNNMLYQNFLENQIKPWSHSAVWNTSKIDISP